VGAQRLAGGVRLSILLAAAAGLAIGLAVGAFGGGGSVLAVPVLVYLLGEPVPDATTASLAVVGAGALAGAAGHARAGRVCWRHAISFTVAAVPGIAAGTLAGEALPDELTLAAFALVMAAAARAVWRRAGDEAPDPGPAADACPPLRLPRDALAGVAVGFVTGLLGVGGGFLIVPTLAVGLAFTMRTAVGTSLAIITASSAIGLGAHLLAGRGAAWDVTAAMAAACVAGSIAGAAVAGRLPQRVLGRSFAALVAAVAGGLLVSAVLGGP
jgi:uncharacterized membrane protein YfcA